MAAVVARPRRRGIKSAPVFSDWRVQSSRALGNGVLLALFLVLMWYFA